MVEVVSHDGGGLVEDAGELILVLDAGDDVVEEFSVVAPRGLDEEFLDGGALQVSCQLFTLRFLREECFGAAEKWADEPRAPRDPLP